MPPPPDLSDQELVVDFLNTVNVDARTDVLDDTSAWEHWVRERELGTPGTPQQARDARDALRTAVTGCGDGPGATDPPWDGSTLTALLDGGRPVLSSSDAVGAVTAAAVRLAVTGEWDRIKICPADECLWAFFDRSKNRSRTWCSMRVCGNRDKARNWRARARVT